MKIYGKILATILVILMTGLALAGEVKLDRWLRLGPFPLLKPAFGQAKAEALLKMRHLKIEPFSAVEGSKAGQIGGKWLKWERSGIFPSGQSGVFFYAAYLEADRWNRAKLVLGLALPFRVWVDGKEVGLKPGGGKLEKEVVLEPGKHFLLVKALSLEGPEKPVELKGKISAQAQLSLSLSPDRPLGIRELLELPYPSALSISDDGKLFAVILSRQRPPEGRRESWIEIRRVEDGSLVQSLRGLGRISQMRWKPESHAFSYVVREKDRANLWLYDLDSGQSRCLLEGAKNFGSYTWSPEGSFIIYSVSEKEEEFKEGVKRVRSLRDRRRGARTRHYLYILYPDSGYTMRLTAGKLTTSLAAISPDGRKLIFTRSVEDYTIRPYSKTQVFCMDLSTGKVRKLFEDPWVNYISWAPDGKRLLVLGGPSAFDGAGIALPRKIIPNEYDTQAYIYNPENGKVEAITKKFNPSIASAFWHPLDGKIYFLTVDRSFRNLYRFDPAALTFTLMESGYDVIRNISFARSAPVAVFTGAGAVVPPEVARLDLKSGKVARLYNPNKNEFRHIKLAEVKDFYFRNSAGQTIMGRVYLPPDFDPSKKYPCIVYYYGGTMPTSRDFGGRYPKNWWAGHGYVVYVLQPRGAIGFGQRFSAYHVNDWGRLASKDIIEGVRKFLKAHPFVDPARLGAIGASFGGFMTQYLLTKTDMFAAAISHAGISSISSYWGVGYWGYAYSAIATANSFPWNRRDIYVLRSPLFNAHRIKTPLLLLHGTADNNVPPGESDQLFTALKLLGRQVEMVKFKGEGHLIMSYKKRVIWWKTIMAWFERWLKGRPGWWNYLYGEERSR